MSRWDEGIIIAIWGLNPGWIEEKLTSGLGIGQTIERDLLGLRLVTPLKKEEESAHC